MAQADQVVQNDTFPTVRADINNNLAALFTNSSGGTAPTVTVAYQDWIDTSGTDPVWKKRNAANNAWITVATISGSAIAFEGTLPSQSGQSGKYLTTDGTIASWSAVGIVPTRTLFASSGTWTCPPNVTSITALVIGGGGGGTFGGGFTRNGGYGGVGIGTITVSPGTNYTITVGAGGTGSVGGTATGGGDTTAFSITATGGTGGTPSVSGVSGTCTSTDANLRRGISTLILIAFDIVLGSESRLTSSGTSPSVYAIDGREIAGARGTGSSSSSLGSGGCAGAVLIIH